MGATELRREAISFLVFQKVSYMLLLLRFIITFPFVFREISGPMHQASLVCLFEMIYKFHTFPFEINTTSSSTSFPSYSISISFCATLSKIRLP